MNKEQFEIILTDADLHLIFTNEFGKDWYTENNNDEGWFIGDDYIQYREEDLFSCHEDGYNWDFYDNDFWRTVLVYVIKSHGYEITHNSGDEEDGLIVFSKK